MLPRRKPPRSGIKSMTWTREWPRHRSFVTKFVCVCFKAGNCAGPIQAAHLNTDELPEHERGGQGLKPHDAWCFPACHFHHIEEQHRMGFEAFQAKYGINLYQVCRQLQRTSPCKAAWAEQDAARAAGVL